MNTRTYTIPPYSDEYLAQVVRVVGVALLARYVYDAWGNHKVLNPDGTENTSSTFIGNINPLRYRGYYYDSDLGLYYLITRYYDPEIGRFISADGIEYLDPETIGGLNLFAYCNNNPVMGVDPTGTFGILVGGTASAISQAVRAKSWNAINWGQVAFDAFIGGVSGALAMSSLGAGAMTLIGGGLGFVQGLGDALISGQSLSDGSTWIGICISTGIGALSGLVGGAGARNAKAIEARCLKHPTEGFIRAFRREDIAVHGAARGWMQNVALAENRVHAAHMILLVELQKMQHINMIDLLVKSLLSGNATAFSLTFGLSYLQY